KQPSGRRLSSDPLGYRSRLRSPKVRRPARLRLGGAEGRALKEQAVWKFLDPGERSVMAIRLAFVSPAGAPIIPASGQTAAWLVHKRALIGAIGVAIGRLGADGDDLLLTLDAAEALPRR